MSGDDGLIDVVGIGHILSLRVAVKCVMMIDGFMQNGDTMTGSEKLAERHLIVGHGSVRCR